MRKILNILYESTCAALTSLYSRAMRSLLTALGIIIGVSSVIAVVAVMQGLSSSVSKQFADLGNDLITLKVRRTAEQQLLGFAGKINYEDFLLLQSRVKQAEDMTAVMSPFSMGSNIQFGRSSVQTQIFATDSSYQNLMSIYPQKGRFIVESDDLRRRRVVFLGYSMVKKLNMPDNPVGEFIKIGGDWFKVIGVAEEKGSFLGIDQDNYIITPFTTARSLNGSQVSDNIEIMFRLSKGATLSKVTQQMRQLLRKRYKLNDDQPDHFEFVSAKKMKAKFDSVTSTITFVASGMVAISLLVAAIGIMNMMLVSVTERTKEIGISKALGAPPLFIMMQFLIEALLLSLFGGVIGLLLGISFAEFIALMMPDSANISVPLWAVGVSFGFTTMIGVIFGFVPAFKAANLNPVDALRYE
ncbi:MAG: FtsX-like permease family protein [Psychromonas sp.]|nr:FtsX-like permease family protein [Psychromonas sp.]